MLFSHQFYEVGTISILIYKEKWRHREMSKLRSLILGLMPHLLQVAENKCINVVQSFITLCKNIF